MVRQSASLWNQQLLLLLIIFVAAPFIEPSAVVGQASLEESSSTSSSSTKDEQEVCSSDSAGVTANGYDSLQEEIPEVWHDERPDTCDDEEFWDLDWRTLQIFRSKYQHVEFCQDPHDDDMCLDLDSIVQICASYRPHYHELMVHYSARFLDSVQRVAFIGGGDSMLLHEVLKYPSLELVIGLELDQQVTRGSFKYFGMQPHWDDERVEWWFGDATKTLMVLPKEYYGSFDLVLVDLSETVMALSVTEELDVMHSLALLLKPNGIFVQNEIMHFLEVAAAFQYTLHSHMYDVPVVCSQSIILGSNQVNFLRKNLTDHKVEYLLKDVLDDSVNHSLIIHDYQRNVSNIQGNCRRHSETKLEEAVQRGSAGVLMMVDAEGVSSDINYTSTSLVQNIMQDVAENEGFSVVSGVTSKTSDDALVRAAVILREGYIVVHCMPELMYCALDIHLWTNLDKQERLKKALLEAIGSESFSSFRIVAGGMFGTKAWKEDEKQRGPLSVEVCGNFQEASRDQEVDLSKVNKVLAKSMSLLEGDGVVQVAVMCGRDSEPCESIQILEKTGKVKVLGLWACGDLTDPDAAPRLLACQTEIIKNINAFVTKQKKPLDAIVVDSSAPFMMGQIVLHIFGSKMRQKLMFAERRLIVSPMKQSWQRVLVDRFRTEIFKDEPLFRTEVLFNTTDSSFGMAYLSSGDASFVKRLGDTVAQMEKDTGLVADIQNVRGAWTFNYLTGKPSRTFTHLDYDQSSPFAQWKSQQQLFRQTVVQLVLPKGSASKNPITPVNIKSALEQVLSQLFENNGAKRAKWVSESTTVGSGFVAAVLWDDGSLVILWDGSAHLDANCVTYEDDESIAVELIEVLKDTFHLEPALLDEHPRGIGRVVNWREDTDGVFPIWASAFATDSDTATS